jgi:hypothetical protein
MAKATYTVPTHLRREDQILSLGVVGVNARQLLLLILAGALTYHFLMPLPWLDHWLGGICLHYLLVALFAGTMAVLIFGQAQGRAFDLWLLILVRYWLSPRRFIWQSFRADAAAAGTAAEMTEGETPHPFAASQTEEEEEE